MSHTLGSVCHSPVLKDRRCEVEVVLRANSVRLVNAAHLVNGAPIEQEARQDFERFWRVSEVHFGLGKCWTILVIR